MAPPRCLQVGGADQRVVVGRARDGRSSAGTSQCSLWALARVKQRMHAGSDMAETVNKRVHSYCICVCGGPRRISCVDPVHGLTPCTQWRACEKLPVKNEDFTGCKMTKVTQCARAPHGALQKADVACVWSWRRADIKNIREIANTVICINGNAKFDIPPYDTIPSVASSE